MLRCISYEHNSSQIVQFSFPYGLAVCRAQGGLPVGFLLRYSVIFTAESLSLLYLLVISSFICFRGSQPIPDDTTEFLHRRADTKHNVTCEDGLG